MKDSFGWGNNSNSGSGGGSILGLDNYRGSYNASGNNFPSAGGSGTAGAVLKANYWIVSTAGTIAGQRVIPGQSLKALIDNPGQTASNWWISPRDLNKPYQNLTSAASITMDLDNGENANLTLGHNVVLTLSNLFSGAKGNIILTQGNSNYSFAISPTPYVYNNGAGVITPGTGNGTKTIVSYIYDGTNLSVNYHSPYTNS